MKIRYAALGASAIAGLAVFGMAPAAFATDVVTPPAGAEPPDYSACTVDRDWGQVCYAPDGDNVWIADMSADGHRTVAVWETSDGMSGECYNLAGDGHWLYCDYHLKEGEIIVFQAQLREGDTLLDTSPWASAIV